MAIDILHRLTRTVLYSSTTQTIAEAVAEARRADADLQGANLRDADLRGAHLWGSDLPNGYRIASLCFGGWGVTVTPEHTQIGCEWHPNAAWLAWDVDAPEIAAMHTNAVVWWARHREAVCAVIRDVMSK